MPNVKCVLIGDNGIGKTCMVISYVTGRFPTEYKPTEFKNQCLAVVIDDDDLPRSEGLFNPLQLEAFNQSRLFNTKADVFLVCFSVINRKSFENLQDVCISDLKYLYETMPFLIVGTQIDLHSDPMVLKRLANKNVTFFLFLQKPLRKIRCRS